MSSSAVLWTQAGSAGNWDYRWLIVDNVGIVVRTSVGGREPSDRAFLTQLYNALKAQETGP